MKNHSSIILFLLTAILHSTAFSEDTKSPALTWKPVSTSIPLEGIYVMISKDSFFLEGRLLAKEEFLTRLASIPKIEGKTNVGLNAIKGCDPNEFITIRDELFGRGYLVCSSAHPIDLNEVYKQLATSNKVIIQANEPNKPTDRDGQAE